jgi:hypothetical protein
MHYDEVLSHERSPAFVLSHYRTGYGGAGKEHMDSIYHLLALMLTYKFGSNF